MNKLKILVEPNEFLRQKMKPVTLFDAQFAAEIAAMLETLRALPGYGLAASQVGIDKRVVVIEAKEARDEEGNIVSEGIPLHILVNPVITKHSKEKCEFDEGCFSVPQYRAEILRPKKIKVVAQDEHGKNIQINASGLLARVMQHEIDHLDGILFTDLVDDPKKLIKFEITDPEWQNAIEG